ncbi:MAG: GNAT family N-acetyltransferase [Candidatus Hodarchaeales archaeon]|jgi:GNAT superfamily N-acetyltransferase
MDTQKLQESDNFEGTIRPINISEDAQNLANFFNSIDDLWPVTFTQGIKYTEKLAREYVEKRNALVTLVAFDPENRLVGFCSIHRRLEEKNVSYIGLLGAHPDVLSKKYGKYLLLSAIDFCVTNGDVRLDLHTWASNMKAVPLYKKIGLQWVPETSVYMQNFIPGILKDQFCNSFFKKHPDWYLNHIRELTQAPDDLTINGINVFKYRFEAENDFLEVLVDQFSRAISGVTRKIDGELISLILSPSQHKVFSGLEEKISLEMVNEFGNELNFDLSYDGSKEITIKEKNKTGTIPRGQTIIENLLTINSTTSDSKQQRKTPSFKVNIELDGENVLLESGMKTQQLVDIYRANNHEWLPSGEQEVLINLQNRSDESISGNLLFWTESPDVGVSMDSFPVKLLEEENQGLKLPILIGDIATDKFITIFSQLSSNGIKSRIFEIPVFISNNPSIAVGTITDQKMIVLRNNFLECTIHLEGARATLVSPIKTVMGITIPTFDYGPPFGFSEFNQVEFEAIISHKSDEIEVRLSSPSRSKRDLIFHRVFSLRSSDSHICTWDEIENNGSQSDQTTTIIQPQFAKGLGIPIGQIYLVYEGKLISGPDFIWPVGKGDLLEGHEKYEPWIFIQTGDTSFYHIFETENILFDPSRNHIGTIEKTLQLDKFTLGKSARSWIGIGNYSWKDVREKAYFLSLRKNISPELLNIDPLKYMEIYIPLEQKIITSPKFNFKLSLNAYRLMPNGGQLMIKAPADWTISPNVLDIAELNLFKPYEFEISGKLDPNISYGTYSLEFVFESDTRQETRRIPFLVIPDQTKPKLLDLPMIDNKSIVSLENKYLEVQSSKDFVGSLVKISYKGLDYLTSNFPNLIPSLLFAKDPGGLFIVPVGRNDDFDDMVFLKEKYLWNQVTTDIWTGIEYSVKIDKRKSLKGLDMKFAYEILGGDSNIVRVRQTIHNPTSASHDFRTITIMSVILDGNIEDIITNFPSEESIPYRFYRKNPIPVGGMGSEKLNHITFTKNGRMLSVLRSRKSQSKILFFDIGKLILVGFYTFWTIGPNQTKEVSNYLITDKPSDQFLDDIRQIFHEV